MYERHILWTTTSTSASHVEILNAVINPASVEGFTKAKNGKRMVEIGLVHFARVALKAAVEVVEAVLPYYRTKFSKYTFTQPQLLAVSLAGALCYRSGGRDRAGSCTEIFERK
jgi:hypothetical protein